MFSSSYKGHTKYSEIMIHRVYLIKNYFLMAINNHNTLTNRNESANIVTTRSNLNNSSLPYKSE